MFSWIQTAIGPKPHSTEIYNYHCIIYKVASSLEVWPYYPNRKPLLRATSAVCCCSFPLSQSLHVCLQLIYRPSPQCLAGSTWEKYLTPAPSHCYHSLWETGKLNIISPTNRAMHLTHEGGGRLCSCRVHSSSDRVRKKSWAYESAPPGTQPPHMPRCKRHYLVL